MNVNEQIEYIKNFIDFSHKQYKQICENEQEIIKDTGFYIKDIEEMMKVDKLTRKVSDYYSDKYLKNLEKFIQDGLNFIFDDKNYSVEVETVDRKNQKDVRLWLIENAIKTEFANNGDGVKSVVSLLIQIFIIEKFGKGKYLFLDESFVEISEEYTENLFLYIKKLITELGFNILLISHMAEHRKYFDTTYEVRNNRIQEMA